MSTQTATPFTESLLAAINQLPKEWKQITLRYLAEGTTGSFKNDAIAAAMLEAIVHGDQARTKADEERFVRLLRVIREVAPGELASEPNPFIPNGVIV